MLASQCVWSDCMDGTHLVLQQGTLDNPKIDGSDLYKVYKNITWFFFLNGHAVLGCRVMAPLIVAVSYMLEACI